MKAAFGIGPLGRSADTYLTIYKSQSNLSTRFRPEQWQGRWNCRESTECANQISDALLDNKRRNVNDNHRHAQLCNSLYKAHNMWARNVRTWTSDFACKWNAFDINPSAYFAENEHFGLVATIAVSKCYLLYRNMHKCHVYLRFDLSNSQHARRLVSEICGYECGRAHIGYGPMPTSILLNRMPFSGLSAHTPCLFAEWIEKGAVFRRQQPLSERVFVHVCV